MAGGNIIFNKGEKLFRAATDEYRTFQVRIQVADVDKAVLGVAQVVDRGGRVVFEPKGSYIETTDGNGHVRKDHLEYKGGMYVMRLWVPRNQSMPFQRQA